MLRRFPFALLVAAAFGVAAAGQEKPLKPKPPKVRPDAVPGYTIKEIEGFTVLLSDETVRQNDASTLERKPVAALELELKMLVGLMPPKALTALRNVLIWVEWDEHQDMGNGRSGYPTAVYFGGLQAKLLAAGKHPLKDRAVTILRLKALAEEHQPARESGRCLMLHELAHAVHDQLLRFDNVAVKAAYKQAMERKLYDPAVYAATNETEYFAEISCAYYDQLGYYPRTRADLKKHDPAGYKLAESVWGKSKTESAAKSTAPSPSGDPKLQIEQVDLGEHVFGPKVALDDLKGRPTLFLIWNAGSSASLSSFQKLVGWDAELSHFGLKTVALHLSGNPPRDVLAAVKSRGLPFAVTEAKWNNSRLIAEFREFPLALLFDAEGKCVYRGSPFEAEQAIRMTVNAALLASIGRESYPKAVQPVVEALEQGKPPATLFGKLGPLSRLADAETAEAAKAIFDKLTESGRQGLQDAEAQAKDDPAAAYLHLEQLAATFKETPVAAKANERMAKLKSDKAVAAELRARPTLATVKKLETELGSRAGSFDPTQDKFRADNAVLLRQLRDAIALMKKSWPKAKATEQAGRIGERYGVGP